MYERINYKGWPNCIRLYNGEIELIVATDIGPRIVRFAFINSQNFFHLVPDQAGKTGGKQWLIYGGHRLWLAPEAIPFSYSPDNDNVEFVVKDNCVKLRQAKEAVTGIVKEMDITLAPDENYVSIVHRLVNENSHVVEVAPWAISVMAQGGRAILPQEPYGDSNDYLLPVRSLALWAFTKMNDPRWIWGARYIQAKHDTAVGSEQKIGVLNKQGWTAYYLHGELLIKRFDFIPGAVYPDYGCNNEIYINGHFLEIETLGPVTRISPKEMIEHCEHWLLTKADADESEESVDMNILPVVTPFNVKSQVRHK